VFFAAGIRAVVEDLPRETALKRGAFGYKRSADRIAVKVSAELGTLARAGGGGRASAFQEAGNGLRYHPNYRPKERDEDQGQQKVEN
jgi:hypothetical protein